MAFQASARDLLPCFEFTLDDVCVIDVHRFLGQAIRGIPGALVRARQEV
jgi:hypothetical protein